MTEKRGAEEVEAAVENGSGQEKKEGERVRKRSRFGAPANAQPAGTEAAPPSAAPGEFLSTLRPLDLGMIQGPAGRGALLAFP